MLKLIPCILLFISTHALALLQQEKKLDWSHILNSPPPGVDLVQGNQVLHFKSKNKPLNEEGLKFVKQYLSSAVVLNSDADVLRYASDHVVFKNGVYIEAGVGVGRTTNFIAALNPLKTIYGFDSLKGLPSQWDRDDLVFKKGTFGYKDNNALPQLLNNIIFYKGLFEEILPQFVDEVLRDQQIALLHIDSDIYSSARTVLFTLKNNLKPGSIIVLDECYNYPGYERNEWKALNEFLAATNLKAKFLAYNQNHEQVALELT